MAQSAILTPVLAMLCLVFAVWTYMYIVRLGFMTRADIDPQRLQTPDKLAAVLPDKVNFAAYNFRNQAEIPVIFYVLCFYLFAVNGVDSVHLTCAWTFVGLRALHSVVQCTYNTVMHRFVLYLFGAIAVWVMLVRAVLQLL